MGSLMAQHALRITQGMCHRPLKRSQEAFVQCWCYGRSWGGYDCGGGGGGGGGGEREHRTRRL
jgi:hypothetical protein